MRNSQEIIRFLQFHQHQRHGKCGGSRTEFFTHFSLLLLLFVIYCALINFCVCFDSDSARVQTQNKFQQKKRKKN